MITERERICGELPGGTFLYCIHCERAYPKDKYRVMSGIDMGLMQMCPYDACDGDAVIDAWEWERIRSEYPEYPEIPEEGKKYPMNNKKVYLKVYQDAHNNAGLLLKSAQELFDAELYPQSYVLAYTALEEISKSQFSADVFTGFRKEEDFKSFYKNHPNKIRNIKWAYTDAGSFPHAYKWIGPNMDDIEKMNPDEPLFQKRQSALYVDVDFESGVVNKPSEVIGEKDAKDIIHIVEVALERVFEVSGEFGGNQIGTKGFGK